MTETIQGNKQETLQPQDADIVVLDGLTFLPCNIEPEAGDGFVLKGAIAKIRMKWSAWLDRYLTGRR